MREVEIVGLLASPVHRYEGRPGDGPLPFDGRELHERVEVRAGLGIVGDRFFGHRAHTQEAVTIMAIESLEQIAAGLDPARTRRNIITRGLDIDAMRGEEFTLDSGDGPVRFRAWRPGNPCRWMDEQVAPGAFRALRGRGGMRCEPLSSGFLQLGPARLGA